MYERIKCSNKMVKRKAVFTDKRKFRKLLYTVQIDTEEKEEHLKDFIVSDIYSTGSEKVYEKK